MTSMKAHWAAVQVNAVVVVGCSVVLVVVAAVAEYAVHLDVGEDQPCVEKHEDRGHRQMACSQCAFGHV